MSDVEWDDLIARIEAATSPDQNLDAEIARDVMGLTIHDWPDWIVVRSRMQDFPALGPTPNYTGSLDAALTLVPNDFADRRYGATIWARAAGRSQARIWVEIMDHDADGGWAIGVVPGNSGLPANSGATPAIALCVAALKARRS